MGVTSRKSDGKSQHARKKLRQIHPCQEEATTFYDMPGQDDGELLHLRKTGGSKYNKPGRQGK